MFLQAQSFFQHTQPINTSYLITELMPPKKKVIQKVIPEATIPPIPPITEATIQPAVDQKSIVLVKIIDHGEHTNGESPKIICPTQNESEVKTPSKKQPETKSTFIRLDLIKTQEQRLQERRHKFAVQPIQNNEIPQISEMPATQQKNESQSFSIQQERIENEKIHHLMKDFSEEDRKVVFDRMKKFGLTEMELLSILSQLKEKNTPHKGNQEKQQTIKKAKNEGNEIKQQKRRFQRPMPSRQLIDSMSKPKKKDELSRSRNKKSHYNQRERNTSKYHRRF